MTVRVPDRPRQLGQCERWLVPVRVIDSDRLDRESAHAETARGDRRDCSCREIVSHRLKCLQDEVGLIGGRELVRRSQGHNGRPRVTRSCQEGSEVGIGGNHQSIGYRGLSEDDVIRSARESELEHMNRVLPVITQMFDDPQ